MIKVKVNSFYINFLKKKGWWFWCMAFNATFNNISVIIYTSTSLLQQAEPEI
jgi:hypothetical protein